MDLEVWQYWQTVYILDHRNRTIEASERRIEVINIDEENIEVIHSADVNRRG
jgi:hypothetical protein